MTLSPQAGTSGLLRKASAAPAWRWIKVCAHHRFPRMTDSHRPFAKLAETDGWVGYLYASAVILLGFVLAFLADRYLSVANLGLIFLTVVLVVAVRTRLSVAVYTAVVCFLGYNFFFTEPRNTLAISSAGDVLAVVLFLVVALVSGHLATLLTRQVASLRAPQRRARDLLALGQYLAVSTEVQAICNAGVTALAQAMDAEVA